MWPFVTPTLQTGRDLGLTLRGGLNEDGTGEDRIIIKEVVSSGVAHQQGRYDIRIHTGYFDT